MFEDFCMLICARQCTLARAFIFLSRCYINTKHLMSRNKRFFLYCMSRHMLHANCRGTGAHSLPSGTFANPRLSSSDILLGKLAPPGESRLWTIKMECKFACMTAAYPSCHSIKRAFPPGKVSVNVSYLSNRYITCELKWNTNSTSPPGVEAAHPSYMYCRSAARPSSSGKYSNQPNSSGNDL